MSRNDTNRKNREAMEETLESFGRAASNGAANILRDGPWNAIAGLQEYNEKLIEIAQDNSNMTLDFFRRTARMKSPLEFNGCDGARAPAIRDLDRAGQGARGVGPVAIAGRY